VIVRRLPASEQGIKAENKHGGTYGMLRDGEDKVFGELWRKAGPQARTNNFLMGALPRYGGHISAGDSLGPILPSHLLPNNEHLSHTNSSTLSLMTNRLTFEFPVRRRCLAMQISSGRKSSTP
jgi:hypothetical protein